MIFFSYLQIIKSEIKRLPKGAEFDTVIAGLAILVTPSSLGYSFLYPHTDNVLDDPAIPRTQKKDFAMRIGTELCHPGQIPANRSEEKTFALIGMIQEEHPLIASPLVHKSLQATHAAQSRSLEQQEGGSALDVIPISMAKGGTSVLADAFLAGTVADSTWLEIAFGYGCVLQLVDDFQDAKKDCERGHRAFFSTKGYADSPEQKLMQLFGFLHDVIGSWTIPDGDGRASFRKLMADSCSFLLFEAVARTPGSFTPAFLDLLAPHAPVRLEFLACLREPAEC